MQSSLQGTSQLLLGRRIFACLPAVTSVGNLLGNATINVQQQQVSQQGLRGYSLLGHLKPGQSTQLNPQVLQRQGLLFRRWMSSEEQQPRKGFEKFYPKDKPSRSVELSNNQNDNKKGREPQEEDPQKSSEQQQNNPYNTGFNNPLFGIGLILAFMLYQASLGVQVSRVQEIDFQTFRNELLAKDMVEKIDVVNNSRARVYLRSDRLQQSTPRYFFNLGSLDAFERKLEDAQRELGFQPSEYVPVHYTTEVNVINEVMKFLPTLLIVGAMIYLTQRQMRGMGGGMGGGRSMFNVGKAQVGTMEKNSIKVSFKDVAGCDEAKQEIMEFVNFLKNPGKYKDLGARIPKGALLVGPPGTGKTLLAKATAGEANVPFLSISGSDFMEMFVGVGPARVRDLFSQARAKSPSIIFIDEIDAIGRARGRSGFAGGNDERENTLNQLLVEMDGFQTTSGVVVLAGTNRPDILDKALLRPGRFDRQISLDRPDVNGREQIFRVHLAKVKLDKPLEYYSERLAALTPGFAGADIANVVNEAALIAARKNKDCVEMVDFEGAVDRVIGGLEKKNKVINKEERKRVAYHEAGHAVVGWFLEHAEPLLKVSIVPRGSAALGFAQYLPNENLLMTTEQIKDMMCMALGGRAAEEILLGSISTGAQNDLEKITQMAYNKVAVYGMNKEVGLISFPPNENRIDKPYSEDTAQRIDFEVRKMIDAAYIRTQDLITSKKDLVQSLAEALLEKEVVGVEQLEAILGPRPYRSQALRNIDKFRSGFQLGEEKPTLESDDGTPPPPTDGGATTEEEQLGVPEGTIVAS
eukprot:TRINITY_DN7469_c0_g1_i1.p1 TRINITY_DN7469_c0_g1~~TRINITY_DN7469_c0_g1_i1.p1  ORF type:complete len:807 (+),score=137.38 TRINITY_DN7469_c0_g1_i1:792-3212(+)